MIQRLSFIVSSRHTSFPIVLLLRQRSWPRGHMLGRAHYTVGMLSKEALVGGWEMGDNQNLAAPLVANKAPN